MSTSQEYSVPIIDTIVQTAWDMASHLIVMSTDGRNGFLDALRGSHSERVLQRTPCPLLAIPVEAAVAPSLSISPEGMGPKTNLYGTKG